MDKKSLIIRRIAKNAIVLALYVALTFASYPLSWGASGGIQLRVSEVLLVLCFFNREYVIPLTIGCLLCNIASFTPWDMLIGTASTALTGLALSFIPYLGIGVLSGVIIQSLLIGVVYLFPPLELNYWLGVGLASIGEVIALGVGYVFALGFCKNAKVQDIINANLHRDFKW
ncbi:MAG: QueT transporter family protein [Bacilli bacterium]|nr:QueT transporter family protein [Bacilli bacterium]